MAQPKIHQLEETARALARDLASGCGHGDHHEGCGHSEVNRKGDLKVSHPSDAAERLADRAADSMDAGRRVTVPRTPLVSRAFGPLAEALRPAGPGRPLARDLQQASEASLSADLSGVRVHDDRRSDALSRHLGADGFSVGSDVYFREGVYGSAAPHDRHVVNHELAHVGGGGSGSDGVIARHASWEHRMLGDVDPAVLEVIASGRDMVEDRKTDKKSVPTKTVQGIDDKGQSRAIGPTDVLHALEQEIERQQLFAKMKPEKREAIGTGKKEAKITEGGRVDQKWQMSILNIPLKDGRTAALTYGEMNTLGDFYGSPEEIGQTDPQQFLNYLYGIREEGIRKFMRLHSEIAKGLGEKSKYDADSDDNRVKDAEAKSQGNTGTSKAVIGGDAWGEVKLMGALGKSEAKKLSGPAGNESENTGYTGGLGRNACHFAPQSWHAWSSYHQKAKALAGQAWTAREAAKASAKPLQKAELEKEGDKKENEALVQNGFGDHFLQDSFASGHLINKTLIMQWFVQWMDEHPFKRDYTSEENWQRVQNIAYGQSALAGQSLYATSLKSGQASDAQSVDNMGGSWQDRFTALGLQIPPSVTSGDSDTGKLLLGWQEQRRLGKLKSTDVTDIKKKYAPVWGVGDVESALKALINDGVVRYSNYSTSDRKKGVEAIGLTGMFGAKSLELTKGYEPKKVEKKKSDDKSSKAGGKGVKFDEKNVNATKLPTRSQKATYEDYLTFLNHGYMQLSTNMLHNYFCENGLGVKSAAETMPYKIYGDNNMLQKESAKGVRFSAETSNMSRDAVYDWATTGTTLNSTAAIESRIPKSVVDSKGSVISLANWHGDNGELHKLCWKTVFPDTAAFFSKSTFIASDALVSTTAQEKIMKDVKILAHDGEGF